MCIRDRRRTARGSRTAFLLPQTLSAPEGERASAARTPEDLQSRLVLHPPRTCLGFLAPLTPICSADLPWTFASAPYLHSAGYSPFRARFFCCSVCSRTSDWLSCRRNCFSCSWDRPNCCSSEFTLTMRSTSGLNSRCV